MPTLDLYKSRKFNVVTFAKGDSLKIPTEYTVEQVERLIELEIALEARPGDSSRLPESSACRGRVSDR